MSKRKILSGAENAAQVTIERNVLVECNHPSVIKVKYAFHTTRALFLVLDLLEGGTLVHAMNQCGGTLPHEIAVFFTAQMTLGLQHLHDHGFVYIKCVVLMV
jgi:serine/threonine protein kinase